MRRKMFDCLSEFCFSIEDVAGKVGKKRMPILTALFISTLGVTLGLISLLRWRDDWEIYGL